MYTTFESIIPLRPSDFDINHHVHHSKYFDLLLAAREDQMDRCYGMSAEEFIDRGWGWMVRRYEIEYKRGLTHGDNALVKTRTGSIGDPGQNKRNAALATIEYEICSEKTGKLCAKGVAVYVMVDLKTGRPKPIPREVIDVFAV